LASDGERCCGRNRRDRRNLIATVPALTRTVTLMRRSLSASEAQRVKFLQLLLGYLRPKTLTVCKVTFNCKLQKKWGGEQELQDVFNLLP